MKGDKAIFGCWNERQLQSMMSDSKCCLSISLFFSLISNQNLTIRVTILVFFLQKDTVEMKMLRNQIVNP